MICIRHCSSHLACVMEIVAYIFIFFRVQSIVFWIFYLRNPDNQTSVYPQVTYCSFESESYRIFKVSLIFQRQIEIYQFFFSSNQFTIQRTSSILEFNSARIIYLTTLIFFFFSFSFLSLFHLILPSLSFKSLMGTIMLWAHRKIAFSQ